MSNELTGIYVEKVVDAIHRLAKTQEEANKINGEALAISKEIHKTSKQNTKISAEHLELYKNQIAKGEQQSKDNFEQNERAIAQNDFIIQRLQEIERNYIANQQQLVNYVNQRFAEFIEPKEGISMLKPPRDNEK